MKAKNVAGYRNYDSSEFARQDALLDDDDAMEAIWKKEYSLAEFVGADQFKSYEDLKKRLGYVLGNSVRHSTDEELEDESEGRGTAPSLLPENLQDELNSLKPTASVSSVEEDDDTLSYFAKLAE